MAAESKLESFMRKKVKEFGGLFWKFRSERRGVPDRIFIHRGFVVFVELKAPGEKPTEQQAHVHSILDKHGIATVVIDTEEAVLEFIERAKTAWLEADAVYQKMEALREV